MLYLSRLDMERIAQRVLRAYRKLPEAQERPACVDPELLARKVLGMTVRYRHLSEDGELLGMDSGLANDRSPYRSGERTTCRGLAFAVIRVPREKGSIRVKAETEGLNPVTVEIAVE